MFERGFMVRYKRFVVSLILLLLLSTFVAVSHHHENTAGDHACPICIASNHQSAAGPLAVAFLGIPCCTETTFIASAPALTDNLFFFSLSTRGPPA
jgi:1-acyl-sn-glycerol-3-phosphate acyltransferase